MKVGIRRVKIGKKRLLETSSLEKGMYLKRSGKNLNLTAKQIEIANRFDRLITIK